MPKAVLVIGSMINIVTQPVMYPPVIGMGEIVSMLPDLVLLGPDRGELIVDLATIVAQVREQREREIGGVFNLFHFLSFCLFLRLFEHVDW